MAEGALENTTALQAGSDSRPASLEQCKIPGPPASMYYIANFITAEEEVRLLGEVNSAPQPQWRKLAHRRLQSLPSPLTASNILLDSPMPPWLTWPVERLLRIPVKEPDDDQAERVSAAVTREQPGGISHVFIDSPHRRPNHCLVNEYLPGQGIMPHEDGPAYHPITATVSLGSHAVLNVWSKRDGQDSIDTSNAERWRILCEPRSLLLTTGDAYIKTLHGIEEISLDEGILPHSQSESGMTGIANWQLLGKTSDWSANDGKHQRQTRVSLTYRDVLKVKTLKGLGILKGLGKR